MDLITLIALIAGIAGILSLLYIAFIGQKSIPEWWRERRGKRATSELLLKPPALKHNLPQPDEFIGREKEKEKVQEALASRAHLVTIDGIAGIGKTALALEVAHELLEESKGAKEIEEATCVLPFDAFIWTTAKDRALDLSDIIDTIARTLDYPGITQSPPERKQPSVIKLLQTYKCLLIIDSLDTITDDAVADFLINLPEPTKALITNRYKLPKKLLEKAWRVSLGKMNRGEALALVLSEGKRLGLRAIEQAKEESLVSLCEEVDGAPLAIKWAVGQLTQPDQSLNAVLESLQRAKADVFEELFARSWSLLSELGQRLLMVMSIFAPSASKAAIEAVSDVHGDAFIQALRQVTNMRLVEMSPELEEAKRRYSIHPLLRNFSRQQLSQQSPNIADEFAQRFVTYLSDCSVPFLLLQKQAGDQQWEVRAENKSARMNWAEVELDNIRAAMDWCHSRNEWKVLIRLVKALSYFYATYGYWNERIRRGHQAAEAARILGDEKTEAWMYVNELGYIMIQQAQYEEAEKLILKGQQILEEQEKTLQAQGKLEQDTRDQEGIQFTMGLAMRYLGILYTKQSKYELAEQSFERAIEIFARLGRKTQIANQKTEMGDLAFRQKNYELAKRYYQESLLYHDSQKDRKHWVYSWMARSYEGLGDIAYQKGIYAEARESYTKGLECASRASSQDGIAYAKYRLAGISEHEQKHDLALKLAEESLHILSRVGRAEYVADIESMIERLRSLADQS